MKSLSFRRSFLVALLWVSSGVTALWSQASLDQGQVGVPYSYGKSFTAQPPPAGTTYSAFGLPTGLSINTSSGVVSGTPTTAGTFNGTISLTSGVVVNSFNFTLLIAPPASAPVISSATTLSGTVGTPIGGYTVTATNSPTSFNVGALPPGLTLNSTIATVPSINGTPSVAGTYSVNLSANNSAGSGAVKTLIITIAPAGPVPTIGGNLSQAATPNQPFSYQISATESPASYSAAPLPLGLSLDASSGVISGSPTVQGVYAITLRATNNNGVSAPATLSLAVGSVPVVSSATAVNGGVGVPFSYQIAASFEPVSYNVSGLPAGLSVNLTSGLISGTPTAAAISTLSISANNLVGTGPVRTVTLTVGNVPSITSPSKASGAAGTSFSYQITAINGPTSYAATSLPAGLSISAGSGLISGTPTAAGTYSVSITAGNVSGTSAVAVLEITIAAPSGGGGSGGGSSGGGSSGGGGGSVPAVPAPVIVTSPAAQAVIEGSSVTLAVSATGSGLNFQWFKDDKLISGAQSASYVIASASAASAGSYYVYVSNSGGGVNSAKAAVTVNPAPPAGPTITSQPVSATAALGGSATFSVSASGPGPFTYQWRKDGAAIAGATSATLALNGLVAGQAGNYSVVVTNAGGSVTSDAAVLTVGAPSVSGTYFGSFGGSAGSFGLLVRADRTAVFLGYVTGSKVVLLGKDFTVSSSGSFTFSQKLASSTASDGEFPRAAADVDVAVAGVIAADGTVSGSVSSLNLSFSAPAGATSGSTSAVAGFYQAGSAGNSAQNLTLVGPAGDALVVNIGSAGVDGGRGTVAADGKISVTTAANVSVSGSVSQGAITLTSGSTTYAGSFDSRNERLLNVSTRSLTGAGGDALIAGFVLTGSEPKPVLIRGIGPTLSAFGVGGALPAVRLEVFRGQASIASGTDWGSATNNPTEVAAVAARVGAFALQANSRDAAMVLNLAPGAYSAVVTGQSGAAGVALVEVYDATAGSIPPAQRVVNIATRSTAGAGDNSLIAGFYVSGAAPKRVLIRGIGPALTQFGVSGALARPQLTVAAGATVLAQNAGLTSSADTAAILAAASQVGAFALPANAADAAILINLAPGAYTAQVSGLGGTTGVALVEVYEVP